MTVVYLDRKAAATYVREKYGVRCSPNYLAKAAVNGDGPTFRKFGASVVYLPDDLDMWVQTKLSGPLTSTSEVTPSNDAPRARRGRKPAAAA